MLVGREQSNQSPGQDGTLRPVKCLQVTFSEPCPGQKEHDRFRSRVVPRPEVGCAATPTPPTGNGNTKPRMSRLPVIFSIVCAPVYSRRRRRGDFDTRSINNHRLRVLLGLCSLLDPKGCQTRKALKPSTTTQKDSTTRTSKAGVTEVHTSVHLLRLPTSAPCRPWSGSLVSWQQLERPPKEDVPASAGGRRSESGWRAPST